MLPAYNWKFLYTVSNTLFAKAKLKTHHHYLTRKMLQQFVFVVCIYNTVTTIQGWFHHINALLKTKLDKNLQSVERTTNYDIRSLGALYVALCDMVDLYNIIWGWQIFLLIINIIISMVANLNLIMIWNKNAEIGRIHFLLSCWTIVAFLTEFLLSHTGELLKNSVNETHGICFKYLCSAGDKDEEIVDEVNLIVEQLDQRKPAISAAGFFCVDYAMVYNLLTTAASYLLVLVQFNT